jgi:hypothetical protein
VFPVRYKQCPPRVLIRDRTSANVETCESYFNIPFLQACKFSLSYWARSGDVMCFQ